MIHCEIKMCVGCRMCEVACGSFHFGAVSPALSRIRVAKQDETGLDMAVACLSCVEKPCLECPTDALTVGKKGDIHLDEELCLACGECVEACPVGAVGFYDEQPLFCDLCNGELTCVKTCPTDALSYKENEEISLEAFSGSEGNPNQKRARYMQELGAPMRENWKNGGRVDS